MKKKNDLIIYFYAVILWELDHQAVNDYDF